MALANENYLKVPQIYCFDEIEKKVNAYKLLHPKAEIIRLGAGDVTRPLPAEVIKAMHKAIDELGHENSFRGYSPPQGYDFLITKIQKEYKTLGISLAKETIFINDGAKSAIGNIGHVLGRDNIIAIAEPVYPVYENATIMSGRAGNIIDESKWSNIVYLACNPENNFIPELPEEKVDVIYICNPNNPTGIAMNRAELKRWVEYAIHHHSIIVYDGAYEAYIQQDDIPRSIYEIKGAKKVAIEVRTFSKTAEFTGLRCGYAVFPHELNVFTKFGESVPLVDLWSRRNSNYTNGVSYIVQRGAEAVFSPKGKQEVNEIINYYITNTQLVRNELIALGFEVFGQVNSPYIWFKVPENMSSWKYFNELLFQKNIVGTPGVLFGSKGEGYMRFTGFSSRENILKALDRLKN
ncbi:MAG TPA: LL-diaminopimelate aminotransferase [Paludibacteraceae bacterium]|nr:LL-diaminopimelate aminotransferase [Paludibacteraceae bacterium]HPT43721.1 LL-diaminopimelate aminotransferase [Paludibacteraceae bacterium]